jgi:hypothetical protein
MVGRYTRALPFQGNIAVAPRIRLDLSSSVPALTSLLGRFSAATGASTFRLPLL